MNLVQTIEECYARFPSRFGRNKERVLEYLFAFPLRDSHWENGELIIGSLQNKASNYALNRLKSLEMNAAESMGLNQDQWEAQKRKDEEAMMERINLLGLERNLLSLDASQLFHLPDNAQPDWVAAAFEFIKISLNDAGNVKNYDLLKMAQMSLVQRFGMPLV